ncbi:MAG TPA: carboxypeptidase regulatory-like domain-containing protein [Candidatus Binatia bacterium]
MTTPASRRIAQAWAVAALLLAATATAQAGDPWLDRVRAFEPGTQAGFGADELPGIVLGPPQGAGMYAGSTDVVSLGNGGQIVVSFDDNAVVDGDGDDLVIFENAFYGGDLLFAEYAFVEVSADGRDWKMFPYDAATGEGLAGRTPVYANSANGMDPLDPGSGGDRFDLADVGLDFVRFVRITDAGDLIDDPGNHSFTGTKGGFDLDAAGAIHSTALGCVKGTVSSAGQPVAAALVVLSSDGQPRHQRRSRANGRYRFCRLRPGADYDVAVHVGGVGQASGRAFIDENQLRVVIDLPLE